MDKSNYVSMVRTMLEFGSPADKRVAIGRLQNLMENSQFHSVNETRSFIVLMRERMNELI